MYHYEFYLVLRYIDNNIDQEDDLLLVGAECWPLEAGCGQV